MPDGQLRFIRPQGPGGLPAGLLHGLQQLQSGQLQAGQQGAGLMQLPPGLMPLRPVLPTVSVLSCNYNYGIRSLTDFAYNV